VLLRATDLVVNDILQVLLRALQRHASNRASSLVRVLEHNSKTAKTGQFVSFPLQSRPHSKPEQYTDSKQCRHLEVNTQVRAARLGSPVEQNDPRISEPSKLHTSAAYCIMNVLGGVLRFRGVLAHCCAICEGSEARSDRIMTAQDVCETTPLRESRQTCKFVFDKNSIALSFSVGATEAFFP
jgi:hypothetical protein